MLGDVQLGNILLFFMFDLSKKIEKGRGADNQHLNFNPNFLVTNFCGTKKDNSTSNCRANGQNDKASLHIGIGPTKEPENISRKWKKLKFW